MIKYELEDTINEAKGKREWSVIMIDSKGKKTWIADFCDLSYAVSFRDAMNKRQAEFEKQHERIMERYGDAFKKLAEM